MHQLPILNPIIYDQGLNWSKRCCYWHWLHLNS